MDSLTHFNKKKVYTFTVYVQHIDILIVTVLEKFMQRWLTAPLKLTGENTGQKANRGKHRADNP